MVYLMNIPFLDNLGSTKIIDFFFRFKESAMKKIVIYYYIHVYHILIK